MTNDDIKFDLYRPLDINHNITVDSFGHDVDITLPSYLFHFTPQSINDEVDIYTEMEGADDYSDLYFDIS